MQILIDLSSNKEYIGKWDFHVIRLEDIDIYNQYITDTEYPANLWSSNFAYLWAKSQSRLRKVLWKIVDDMLVTFGHSFKNSLYLFCLPFGKGNPEKLIEVVIKSMKYCYNRNNQEDGRTLIRMLNHNQLEFLQNCPVFDRHFRSVTLQGIERHLNVKKLVSLTGKDFSTVRYKINKFHRDNPNAVLRRYQPTDYEQLIELRNHWDKVAGRKYIRVFDKVYYREIIKNWEPLNQVILVVENDHQIIGMVSGGVLPTGQAWGSLLKYREAIPGLSELLSVEFARELNKMNPAIEFMNVGSDLGAGGLRDYKLKFRPVLNLKRYQVFLKP